MDKSFSAKKYFIFGFKKYFNNDNRVLAKKYAPSLREILFDYIEMHEDLSRNQENDKLESSRNELLEALKFFLTNSILNEEGFYKFEIEALIKQIDNIRPLSEKNKLLQYVRIYNTCKSLVKKIDKDNVYAYLVNMILKFDQFSQMDEVIESIISEALYDGYSLKFLDEWFNDNIGNKELLPTTIDDILHKFEELKKEKVVFKYYLSVLDNEKDTCNEFYVDFDLKLIKEDFAKLCLYDSEKKDIKSFLQSKRGYSVFSVEIKAMDLYKGLELIVDAVNSYFQMNNFISSKEGDVINNKAIVRVSDEFHEKLRIEQYDNKILFSSIENRERQDIEDFINYRDRTYIKRIKSDEISNIQRALNIVKSQKNQSRENRLINLWAAAEYILTSHEGLSIISKVKDVVPKLVCLYIMKDKLNIFWNRVLPYRNSEIEIIKEMLNVCSKDSEDEYDLNKLTSFILEKGEKLIDKFEFNDVLKRSISEIGLFLTNSECRYNYITTKHSEITHDLVRIYRTRNVLIHSSHRTRTNIDIKALRLYQYNNHLLGVIIYFINKNPHLTIAEVLNSIIYTYEEYLIKLKDKNALPLEICKPKFLFL